MKNDMLDLCAWTIEQARQAGANQCKVTVSRSRSVDLNYRERKPETVKEATEQSLSLHVYAEGKYSAQGTADLRKESLRQFVANAVATTRLLAEDPHRSLPDPKYYEGRATLDLKINDPAYPQWSPDARHALARAVEEACLATGDDKVISVTAGVYDEFHESAVMSSNGLEGVTASTGYSAGATMTARDAGDRRPAGYYYVAARNRQSLPDAALVGRTAATRTLAMLGAKKVHGNPADHHREPERCSRVARARRGSLWLGHSAEAVVPGQQERAVHRQSPIDAGRRPSVDRRTGQRTLRRRRFRLAPGGPCSRPGCSRSSTSTGTTAASWAGSRPPEARATC